MFARTISPQKQLVVISPAITVDGEVRPAPSAKFFRELARAFPEERLPLLGAPAQGPGLWDRILALFGLAAQTNAFEVAAREGELWYPPARFASTWYYCQYPEGQVPEWIDGESVHLAHEAFRRARGVVRHSTLDSGLILFRAERRGEAAKREQRVRFVPDRSR